MKLGLFGGSFDPVHNAHLFIAEALREEAGLERIVFLPTGIGRHRDPPRASVEHRAAMLRSAIAANPAFALDLTDTDAQSTGYTADLIPRMRARFPDDELYFIAGGDSLVHTRWQRLDAILSELTGFLIAPRGEVTEADLDTALADLPAALRIKIRLHDLPRANDSATTVRGLIENGKSFRYLVPEPVWRYIVERELYNNAPVAP